MNCRYSELHLQHRLVDPDVSKDEQPPKIFQIINMLEGTAVCYQPEELPASTSITCVSHHATSLLSFVY